MCLYLLRLPTESTAETTSFVRSNKVVFILGQTAKKLYRKNTTKARTISYNFGTCLILQYFRTARSLALSARIGNTDYWFALAHLRFGARV